MVQNERESNFGYECTGCPVLRNFVPSWSKNNIQMWRREKENAIIFIFITLNGTHQRSVKNVGHRVFSRKGKRIVSQDS